MRNRGFIFLDICIFKICLFFVERNKVKQYFGRIDGLYFKILMIIKNLVGFYVNVYWKI